MPIPTKPDPYEIAFLRGGENEVTRLLAFDLINRGYLRVAEKGKPTGKGTDTVIEADPGHPYAVGEAWAERMRSSKSWPDASTLPSWGWQARCNGRWAERRSQCIPS